MLGREHHDRLVAQLHAKSARQVLGLLSSRHDDNRPSRARQAGLHRTGHTHLPRLGRQARPSDAVRRGSWFAHTVPVPGRQRTPRHSRGVAVGQPGQKLLASHIVLPAALVRGQLPGGQITWGLVPLGILGRGVPGGQGESDDIGTRPGTPTGDCLNEPTRGFRKDRKVGDHTA